MSSMNVNAVVYRRVAHVVQCHAVSRLLHTQVVLAEAVGKLVQEETQEVQYVGPGGESLSALRQGDWWFVPVGRETRVPVCSICRNRVVAADQALRQAEQERRSVNLRRDRLSPAGRMILK